MNALNRADLKLVDTKEVGEAIQRKVATLTYPEETAEMFIRQDGTIVITRKDANNALIRNRAVEDVLIDMTERGWKVDVHRDLSPEQQQLEKFIELHRKHAALKKELEEAKAEVRKTMNEKGLHEWESITGATAVLQETSQSNATARYSTYEVNNLEKVLPKEVVGKMMVSRVDTVLVDAYLKDAEKSEKELVHRMKNKIEGSPALRVRG